MKFGIFSNNVLKIIACIFMVIDHIGFFLFPKVYVLRMLGRISFPIFAFLLVEGCYYTKNKLRHLLVMIGFAAIIQAGLYIGTRMVSFSIFIPFSIAVLVCYLIDYIDKFIRNKKIILSILLIVLSCLILGFSIYIDNISYLFYNNYGIYGFLVPVVMYLIRKYIKYLNLSIILCAIVLCISMVLMHFFTSWLYQLYGIIGCLLILAYNGKKGKLNLKYFFYIFYPAHLIIIYAIGMFFGG